MQRSIPASGLNSCTSATGTKAAWGSRARSNRFASTLAYAILQKSNSFRSAGGAFGFCGFAPSTSDRCHGWQRLRCEELLTTTAAAVPVPSAASTSGTRGSNRAYDDDLPGDEGDGAARLATARRLKMVVAYDGCEFAGFQFQPGKVRTVQGELERCAKRLFHGSSRMVGASRTDGGAHAYGQVVHFDVYGTRDSLESDALYYNSFLPPDVRVLGLSYAEDGFDSHFSSCGKTYLYKFSSGLPDPMQAKYRWWVYDRWCERSRGKPGRLSDVELDVGLMQRAADLLLGRHDFSAFMDNKRPAGLGSAKRKNPKLAERGIKPERTSAKNTRILSHLRLRESVSPVSGGQEVEMEVTGNGFLYRMVRMLAAGLVEVGHRRLSPEGLRVLLARADRSALPEAAPPHGLYLARVHYPGDEDFESRIQRLADRIRSAGAGGVGGGDGGGSAPPPDGIGSAFSTKGTVLPPQLDGRGASPVHGSCLLAGGSGAEVGVGGALLLEAGATDPRVVRVDEAGPNQAAFPLPAEQGQQRGVAQATAEADADEAEWIVRELRLTQGQKAAALMRAAAAERRRGGAGGGGSEGADGAGGPPSTGAAAQREGQQSLEGLPPAAGLGQEQEPEVDFSLLKDREDDQ